MFYSAVHSFIAHVKIGNRVFGTAFVVTSRVLLTCEHVAGVIKFNEEFNEDGYVVFGGNDEVGAQSVQNHRRAALWKR